MSANKTKLFTLKQGAEPVKGYLVGSQSLNLSQVKDADYLIIDDTVENGYARAVSDEGDDLFICSTQNVEAFASATEPTIFNLGRCWHFKGIVDDSFPQAIPATQENIDKLKKFIKDYITFRAINKVGATKDGTMRFASFYTTLFIDLLICEHGPTDNGRVSFSPEELQEIDDVHALNKPISFANEVIARIEAL